MSISRGSTSFCWEMLDNIISSNSNDEISQLKQPYPRLRMASQTSMAYIPVPRLIWAVHITNTTHIKQIKKKTRPTSRNNENKRSLGGPASRPRISSKAASLGLVEGEIFTVEKWRSWEQWTWIFLWTKNKLKKKTWGTGTNKKSIMSCFFLYKKSMWWIVMGWWM